MDFPPFTHSTKPIDCDEVESLMRYYMQDLELPDTREVLTHFVHTMFMSDGNSRQCRGCNTGHWPVVHYTPSAEKKYSLTAPTKCDECGKELTADDFSFQVASILMVDSIWEEMKKSEKKPKARKAKSA